jgi:hypothetical protein
MGVKARVRKWVGTEEIATNVAELRNLLTSGTVRVDETMATMTRIHLQNNKDKDSFRTRLVECRKGHGVIGQIFSEWLNEWIGVCKDCDDCPQEAQA